ncbi:MAG: heparinase II/III family protein [Victivallaceae bacterium]|nr:heparinase II/III family protein [Victivallaceae bacterium]
MKNIAFALLTVITALSVLPPAAGSAMPDWDVQLRRDRPRLLVNREQLDAVRQYAAGSGALELEKLKRRALAPVETGALILKTERFDFQKNGKIKLAPGVETADNIIENMGIKEASSAAMVYMITGDPAFRDRAVEMLRQADRVLEFCLQFDAPVDYHTESMMNLMCAFDWMYEDTPPDLRDALARHLAEYVREMQPDGRLKVFKTAGPPDTGFYGTLGMLFPAGIVLTGTAADQCLVRDFLNTGYAAALEAMNFRDRIAGNSGLLVAGTPTYSFGAYPLASFLFFMENRAALGLDLRDEHPHLANFINWFLWSTIPDGSGGFYHYGAGDVRHSNNRFDQTMLYGHFVQIVNLYSDLNPAAADRARALLAALPPDLAKFNDWHPFMPLLMTGFDPSLPSATTIERLTAADTAAYFPAFGLAFMRSGYTPDSTFALFRSGSENTNHQHYDENSFVIFRNGFLALDTGDRMRALHHIYYYPQTIAHNTVLIDMPNEPMPPHWEHWTADERPQIMDGLEYFCDGGQNRLLGGRCRIFRTSPDFTWVSGDATACYSAQKCELAQREFVFIPPSVFLVGDRVRATRPEYSRRWLLHTQNEPVKTGAFYTADNGSGGRLVWRTLLPRTPKITLIGGKDREFFTNGRNLPLDTGAPGFEKPNFYGRWRYEMTAGPEDEAMFIHALQALSPGKAPADVALAADNRVIVTMPDGAVFQVVFNTDAPGGTIEKYSGADLVFRRRIEEK